MLERLDAHYTKHRRDPKELQKWLEYVRISSLLNKGFKAMLAYSIVSLIEKARAVQKRYLKQKEKARKLGFNINSDNADSSL